MKSEKLPVKRKRGRPPKSDGPENSIHDVIVEAAEAVCCEKGVHGLTVELILRKAGVSRPTFYKFFKNKDEVIHLISKGVNKKLIDAMAAELENLKKDDAGFIKVIDAYLNWGMETGPIVGRLYQAVKDENSFPAKNRQETIELVIFLVQDAIVSSGRPAQDPVFLDALVNTVEYLCNPIFAGKHDEEYFKRIRGVMIDSFIKLILNT